MMRVIVLGGGLVGSVIARDLAGDESIEVTVADRDEEVLKGLAEEHSIRGIRADLSSSSVIRGAIADFDLVVGAVPGALGFNMLKTVIEAGKNVVDISFAPEDYMELDSLARNRDVIAVVDCGVAPGLSNLLVGYAANLMDEPARALILVGGLPVERIWPYEYKIVFSPIDVIDEYLRPSRMVEHGKVVVKPALSEVELVDLPGVGTLEAFNTDGLRSLIHTVNVPNMKEKTLRFPGHAEKMRMLRDTGFFSQKAMTINGVNIRPIDVTANLLFSNWKLKGGEKEFTVMRVEVEGVKGNQRRIHSFDLLDYYHDQTKTTSMARTTGFPCAAFARLVLEGRIRQRGICPPEHFGQDPGVFQRVIEELDQRGVAIQERIKEA